MARKKKEEEERWRAQYKQERDKQERASQDPPFLNLEKITPLIRFLIAAFVLVHLPLYLLGDAPLRFTVFNELGLVPERLTTGQNFTWYTPLTFITHMFVHGSWMHLGFNLVMTLALGIFFERTFGPRTTGIFFVLCGIAGGLAYIAYAPFSAAPVVGASGGISGFFGAALMMMHAGGQMGSLSPKSPWPIIGFWIVLMLVIGLIGGGIAWQAHIGGFITGVALYEGLRRGKIRF